MKDFFHEKIHFAVSMDPMLLHLTAAVANCAVLDAGCCCCWIELESI
jgi:hypothetical protein